MFSILETTFVWLCSEFLWNTRNLQCITISFAPFWRITKEYIQFFIIVINYIDYSLTIIDYISSQKTGIIILNTQLKTLPMEPFWLLAARVAVSFNCNNTLCWLKTININFRRWSELAQLGHLTATVNLTTFEQERLEQKDWL